jgi:hypothetical protein
MKMIKKNAFISCEEGEQKHFAVFHLPMAIRPRAQRLFASSKKTKVPFMTSP